MVMARVAVSSAFAIRSSPGAAPRTPGRWPHLRSGASRRGCRRQLRLRWSDADKMSRSVPGRRRSVSRLAHARVCVRARRSARCLIVSSIFRSISHDPGSMTGYPSQSFGRPGGGVEAVSADQPGVSVCRSQLERPDPGAVARANNHRLLFVESLDAHRVAGHRYLVADLEVLEFGDDAVDVVDVDAETTLDPVVGVGAAASRPHLDKPRPDRRR